jgi:Zn-finger nucleic acid-binding protein
MVQCACPRCGSGLFEGPARHGQILGCGRCGGVWLDGAGCRAIMQGAGEELVELAERAGRRATVAPDSARPPCCPTCEQPLTRGEVPGTAVAIDSCAAHGTWFDRNALRLVALRFAKLPPPLPVRREDYQLPPRAPETFGDWVLQEAFGAPKKTVNDAIPYVAGVRAGGTFWTDEVLGILLAIALLGTATSCAMHVASLLGHTVTNGLLLLVTTLAIFPPFCLGIWANYQMGNADKIPGGFAMGTRHLLCGLHWIEWVAASSQGHGATPSPGHGARETERTTEAKGASDRARSPST